MDCTVSYFYIHTYLPTATQQMIRILAEEKPEVSVQYFNGHNVNNSTEGSGISNERLNADEGGSRGPDLIWTSCHRRQCFALAKSVIQVGR